MWRLLHQESNLGRNNPASYAGSNSNSIFKLVTALIVKAMRNKKRRRRIFIGPCTKPAYTGKGFHFRVFHKTNEFSINDSFFRLFVWPVCNFGPLCRNERKSQSETKKKSTCHNSSRKALQKGLCKHLLSAIIALSSFKLVINSRYLQSAVFYPLLKKIDFPLYIVLCSFLFFSWYPFNVNNCKSEKPKKKKK